MFTVVDRIGHGRFVSFELWPPRTPESAAALEDALAELTGLAPAFVAVTYGAGGSTRERTHDLVVRLVDSPLLPLAHLTCAAHNRHELVGLMQRYRKPTCATRSRSLAWRGSSCSPALGWQFTPRAIRRPSRGSSTGAIRPRS